MVLSAAVKRVVRPVTGTGPLYRTNEQTEFVRKFGESMKLYIDMMAIGLVVAIGLGQSSYWSIKQMCGGGGLNINLAHCSDCT